jgi:putative PIN family toxin of toxin-antitoxin system
MPAHQLWVLDTHVLISAALSSTGLPALLLGRLLQSQRLVFCQATFDELRTRLCRPKFDRCLTLELRERLLHGFSACAHWIDLAPHPSCCRDADGDQFIALALQSGAVALVTGDSDWLEAPPQEGLHIWTPAQAWAWLGQTSA